MSSPKPSCTIPSAWPVLVAPAHWRRLDFISDLHLQASEPATFKAWQQYLNGTTADAVFILGDLFEVWVGDDVAIVQAGHSPGFEAQCQQLLAAASQRMAVFFMHGNRDFLLGDTFASACGMTLLADPTVLAFDGERWLMSHGDELCLGDIDYQQFRATVRTAAWRDAFLGKPLAERRKIARDLRAQSESRKICGATYADVDTTAALQWLKAAQATTLIHGHTHRPADHLLEPTDGAPKQRLVLSDWDAGAAPARMEVLQLSIGAAPVRLKP